ncbi:DNA gyrase subunit A [Alphaproteobacteria bacterium endosymbiont of Tiliacea citrago]|uniref:DNA gyrase subunit A n=1 Tax=Alphaproteobacteria bacterium endosymbiont of Tiliacea citrago TaxID=3077944 RepID=UPI00313ACAA3
MNMSSTFLLNEQLATAYGVYAMSVIKGRALPRLQDGLKPVQRRILYSMFESGFRYNKPFKKCGRIVGDVLGKYHPHGDAPIYEALVHLAQSFIMSSPLVRGQGNFGSIDGDKAASSRYTEARLEQISEYLLQDYDKDTVPFKLNYDSTLKIPDVLPAQFPNLLVNGSSGIAVGMATNIPPHNLGEVLDATIALLENENISLDEIMAFIKGPDFPTGGEFFGGKDLKRAYETGRGKVILRGTIEEEAVSSKVNLIITSIPYQASKAKIIEKIVELVEEGVLDDVSDVRDESSKIIRIVIELKKNANIEIIKQRIFALTTLQSSFSFNMVAINNEKPQTFGLLEILREFLKFREEVVIKRAEFILKKTLAKTHIVWGLYLATNMLDKIISTIRESENPKEAEEKLMMLPWSKNHYSPILDILGDGFINDDPYYFSQEQVKGILDLKLQKLTKLEKNLLLDELNELKVIIDEQNKIIINRQYRLSLMKDEFVKIKEKFAGKRRTNQLTMLDDLSEESLIEAEDVVIMISAAGYIKRVKLEEYKVQNRGGRGKLSNKKVEDPIINLFMINTLTSVLFFTNKGKVFEIKGYQIPECSLTARGRAAVNLFKLDDDEFISTILPMETDNGYLFFVTSNGTVRKNKSSDFLNIRVNGKIAMKFEENDSNKLHSVLLVNDGDDVLLTSSIGNAIRFSIDDVRIFESRSSQGIRGMNLKDDEHIVGATKVALDAHTEFENDFVQDDKKNVEENNGELGSNDLQSVSVDKIEEKILNSSAEILCVTKNGFGKRSSFDEYRRINRGGKGSKAMNINNKTGELVSAVYVEPNDEILIMSNNSQTIRISLNDIRKSGRVTSGVCLIKLPANDFITQVLRVTETEESV